MKLTVSSSTPVGTSGARWALALFTACMLNGLAKGSCRQGLLTEEGSCRCPGHIQCTDWYLLVLCEALQLVCCHSSGTIRVRCKHLLHLPCHVAHWRFCCGHVGDQALVRHGEQPVHGTQEQSKMLGTRSCQWCHHHSCRKPVREWLRAARLASRIGVKAVTHPLRHAARLQCRVTRNSRSRSALCIFRFLLTIKICLISCFSRVPLPSVSNSATS